MSGSYIQYNGNMLIVPVSVSVAHATPELAAEKERAKQEAIQLGFDPGYIQRMTKGNQNFLTFSRRFTK